MRGEIDRLRSVRDWLTVLMLIELAIWLLWLAFTGRYVLLDRLIDDTTYFYAYSTISQSLASAFGFLVTVAVYRITSTEQGMERDITEVIEKVKQGPDESFLKMKARCHDWEDMDDFISQDDVESWRSNNELKGVISTSYRAFVESRKGVASLKKDLVSAFAYTTATIALSITMIPVSRLLRSAELGLLVGPLVAAMLLFVVIYYTFHCLNAYWHIISRLTDRRLRDIYASVGSGGGRKS